ncbi:hypothetical protein FACS189468_8490 [Spirochaetia bacterium]|nr:hypothetical protein FACS189468_8490 [Spirochaetia bacterium]
MSVRATDSLIAEIVTVSGLPNSPQMVVQSVKPETKLITTIWFSDTHEAQQGVFPSGSLDKATAAAKKPQPAKKQPAKPAKRK